MGPIQKGNVNISAQSYYHCCTERGFKFITIILLYCTPPPASWRICKIIKIIIKIKLGLQNRLESNCQRIRKGNKKSHQSAPNQIQKGKTYLPNDQVNEGNPRANATKAFLGYSPNLTSRRHSIFLNESLFKGRLLSLAYGTVFNGGYQLLTKIQKLCYE